MSTPARRGMLPSTLTALALVLADEYARSCFGSDSHPAGDGWYELPPPLERDGSYNRTLRYLRARGMLVENPKQRGQWRTRAATR